MFLNRLSIKEKQAFLNLAHHVAHSDEEFSSHESLYIANYCMEMQIDDVEYDPHTFDLNKILDTFSGEMIRKIVLIELLALIFADGKSASSEQDLIDKIVAHFDLNPNLAIVYKEWAKSMLSLYLQGEALIHI